MRLIIPEYIHEDALKRLERQLDVRYDPELHNQREELLSALASAQALIVRNRTQVDRALLAAAPQLQVVGRLGVGLDNVDVAEANGRGVVVTWAPGTNATSVAEYVMGVMLEFSRRFGEVSRSLHAGRWDRQGSMGSELQGRTVGVVGLGDIGARLAKRARAFGLRVLASDPIAHSSSFAVQEYEVQLVALETLLRESDFVSLHVPLLPSTRDLIDQAALDLMKPSAYLINTARGGLVDESALATALQRGIIAGAALDVRQQEPPGEDDPLRGLANVILTPHVAGVTHESNRRASLHVAEDVLRVHAGEKPLSPAPG